MLFLASTLILVRVESLERVGTMTASWRRPTTSWPSSERPYPRSGITCEELRPSIDRRNEEPSRNVLFVITRTLLGQMARCTLPRKEHSTVSLFAGGVISEVAAKKWKSIVHVDHNTNSPGTSRLKMSRTQSRCLFASWQYRIVFTPRTK